ncbi:MAG: pilus assembly protein PilM [Candidatus Omnitrophota bacterium]
MTDNELQLNLTPNTIYTREQAVSAEAVIGIDIGYRDIKIAELRRKRTNDEWQVESCEILDFSQSKSEDENKVKINILKKFFEDKNIKKAKVACLINDANVLNKRILTPLLSDSELKEAIHYKTKEYINFPLSEASIDFKIIGKVEVENETKDEILVVACPQKAINDYLSLFKELRILPTSFVSLAVAIEHNLSTVNPKDNETVAFVDLGATHTELQIFKERKFKFGRKLPVIANAITKALTTVLQGVTGKIALTFEEAEIIKKECGLPQASNETVCSKTITANQVLSLIRPEIEKLVSEIEHSFYYYREEFQAGKVDRLILLGAGANLKNLAQFLAKELGIGVEVAENATFFASIGVARSIIEQLKTRQKEINLLPKEIKEQNQLLIRRLTFEVIITVFILTYILFLLGLKVATIGMHKRLEAIKAQIYSLRYKQQEAYMKGIISQVYSREPLWHDCFVELSNIIGENVYLTRLSHLKDELTLEGVVVSKTDTTESILSDLMLKLEKGIFKNVSLIESKTQKDDTKPNVGEFIIKCQIE